jgi:hypothetical protein
VFPVFRGCPLRQCILTHGGCKRRAPDPCEVSANSQAFLLWKCFHNRKNWLFSQTPKGAHASAKLYSLIETARANGIEPYTYMIEVFTKLPTSTTDDELDQLLPWNRAKPCRCSLWSAYRVNTYSTTALNSTRRDRPLS